MPLLTSVIICGCNEKKFESTIASALEDDGVGEVIAVDDYSDVPLEVDINDPRIKIVRSDKQLGVGGARNFGASFVTMPVMSFHDAHMEFPDNVISKVSKVSYDEGALVCPACWNTKGRRVGTGANMYYDVSRSVVLGWIIQEKEDVIDVPAVLGAHYTIPLSVWEELGPWLDDIGRWGFSEECISLKAHFLGVPVLCMPNIHSNHEFRSGREQPFSVPAKAKVKNMARSLFVIWDQDHYDNHFRTHLVKHLGESALQEIEQDERNIKDKEEFQEKKVVSDETVFQFLNFHNSRNRAEKAKEGIILSNPLQKTYNPDGTVIPPARPVPKKDRKVSKKNIKSSSRDVTVILLNWKRPENLENVINSLAIQTLRPRIVLWNNGEPYENKHIDWTISSSENVACWPRWFIGSICNTEYIMSLDDDLKLYHNNVVADMVTYLEGCDEHQIIGPYGVVLVKGKDYKGSNHITMPGTDTPVDIIKGRSMMFRRSQLAKVAMYTDIDPTCDDIAINGILAGGRRLQHICPGVLKKAFYNMPRRNKEKEDPGLDVRPDHYKRRDAAVERFFGQAQPLIVSQPAPSPQPAPPPPAEVAQNVERAQPSVKREAAKKERVEVARTKPPLPKLNLGCGSKHKEGYVNIDIAPPADVVLDVREGLPYEDSSVEEIYADNFMEHLDFESLVAVMNECHRVLKFDGKLTFIVPSAEKNWDAAIGDPSHKMFFLPRTVDYWTAGCNYYKYGQSYGFLPWRRVSLAHRTSLTVVQQPEKKPKEAKKEDKKLLTPAELRKSQKVSASVKEDTKPKGSWNKQEAENVAQRGSEAVRGVEIPELEFRKISGDDLPSITGLCCTHGRVKLLSRILTCFVEMNYPTNKKFLYILNDADIPIHVDIPGVKVFNEAASIFQTLGHKRQFLLDAAETDVVAQIDDDDLYRSSHFLWGVQHLLGYDVGCVKQKRAFYAEGNGPTFRVRRTMACNFEGMKIFRRREAIELGGYSYKDSGQALDLMNAFRREKRFQLYAPLEKNNWTYIYCWDRAIAHASHHKNKEKCENLNRDYGDGGILYPADITAERKAFRAYVQREF